MSGTVQLMALLQILPAMLRLFDCKISIQVSVFLLCLFNGFNHLICPFFQFRIRMHNKRICNCLQPFCHIAVLENHSVKFTFFHTCSNSEIGQCMAFFYSRNFIVQNFFLIRNYRLNNKILHWFPESVLNLYIFQ